MRNHLRTFCLLLALPCFVVTSAYAQADDEEAQAGQHFAKGRRLYSAGKYKEAIEELLKAFELRPAPPILLNIGRTYEKVGDKAKALEFYRKFLETARIANPSRPEVEKLVKKLEAETGAKAEGDGGLETTAAEKAGSATVTARLELIHTPIDSAQARKPITVSAELPPGAEADKIVVYVRRQGETEFHTLTMAKQGDGFIATIPGSLLTATSLQYYIAALKTGADKPVALAGSKHTPHIVVVEGGLTAGQMDTLRSPYRTWLWTSAGASVAMLATTALMAVLAADRANAVEEIAKRRNGLLPANRFDTKTADGTARDFESQGKTFATVGQLMFGLGLAAAAGAGYLWYRDRKWLTEHRGKVALQPRRRLIVSGWADAKGGGLATRLDF